MTAGVAPRSGYSLPRRYYTEPEVFRADMDWLAGKWLYAGHGSDLPKPGARLVARLGRDEAILLRDGAGAVRGFANVCRHRGSRLCDGPAEGGPLLCPYHGWRYGLDGALQAAPAMAADFDRAAMGLTALPVFEMDGLIFVCFSPAPPDPGPAIAALRRMTGAFGWARARVAARVDYALAANWKLLLENYHECYHCRPAHPEFSALHVLARPDGRALGARDAEHWPARADGVEVFRLMHSTLADGAATGSRDGRLVAPMMADAGCQGHCVFAELGFLSAFLAYADHGVIYEFRPEGTDASTMRVTWLVRADAVAGRDFDMAALTWLWRVTSDADKAIIERNQRGVSDRNYRPGPYSVMEPATAQFTARYLAEREASH